MKYQQLENLEAGWKWAYLVKKHKEGEQITRYVDSSEQSNAIDLLIDIEHRPTEVLDWINTHMALELDVKMKQAIRAKRKRYYNAEHEHTKKKSIDLDFVVWKKLSTQAKQLDATLSDTIEYLISQGHYLESEGESLPFLEPKAMSLLSEKAKEINASLAETIEYLLVQEGRSKISAQQISALKQDLNDLLNL